MFSYINYAWLLNFKLIGYPIFLMTFACDQWLEPVYDLRYTVLEKRNTQGLLIR